MSKVNNVNLRESQDSGKPEFDSKGKKFKKGKFGKSGSGRGKRGSFGSFNRGKQFNDVSFYKKNPGITDAFTKLPFNYIVGNMLAGIEDQTVKITSIVSYMVDWVLQTVSTDQLRSDGGHYFDKVSSILNQVATIIYTQMRRANAGATNAIEHVDVIVSNLLASIDIYANVHYIHRIFKLGNVFSWKNRGIPKYIFKHHLNIDYDDFIANQANYRGRFNTLVAKAKTIRTLANFPFISALVAQFSSIFKDTDTDTGREQLIISVKPFHHIYDPVGTEGNPGGSVRIMQAKDVPDYKKIFSTQDRVIYTGVPINANMHRVPVKFSVLLSILNAQIDALINDSDFNLIQADIEKAFGEQSGYIVVDPVGEDLTIQPEYSGEFMNMFHNGVFFKLYQGKESTETNTGLTTLAPNYYVNSAVQGREGTDDPGVFLECYHGFYSDYNDLIKQGAMTGGDLLDLQSDDPNVDDIIIATRFKTLVNDAASDFNTKYPVQKASATDSMMTIYCGSNFICWGGNITYYFTDSYNCEVDVAALWNSVDNAQFNELLLSIENHPIPRVVVTDRPIIGEINNIRGIRVDELRYIHDACFLSLWDLPSRTNV